MRTTVNPITNDVFDTRDLIDYIEHIESDIIDNWNDLSDDEHQAECYDDIFGTSGYEFADDVSEIFDTFFEDSHAEIEELEEIKSFGDELSRASDYTYGCTVISENYFTEYCEELLKDCGYIPQDFPSWIELDFEATADKMKVDYFIADYNGTTYYIR